MFWCASWETLDGGLASQKLEERILNVLITKKGQRLEQIHVLRLERWSSEKTLAIQAC